jgi:hypothetical protein
MKRLNGRLLPHPLLIMPIGTAPCNSGLTAARSNFTLKAEFNNVMAENTPTPPGGALPPRPAESAKVQPKKETVRINLPPKPTSAPTIKLPTLAPGAPPPSAAAPSAAAPVAIAVASAPAAPRAAPAAPVPPSAPPATRVAQPATAAKSAPTAAPMVAPRPAYAAAGLTGLDKGLAIAAAVIAVLSAGIVAYLVFFLKDTGS